LTPEVTGSRIDDEDDDDDENDEEGSPLSGVMLAADLRLDSGRGEASIIERASRGTVWARQRSPVVSLSAPST